MIVVVIDDELETLSIRIVSVDLTLSKGETAGYGSSVSDLFSIRVDVTVGVEGRLTTGLNEGTVECGWREKEGSGNDVSKAGIVIICSETG